MLFTNGNTRFLNPSALMYELNVLREIQKHGYVLPPQGTTRGLSDGMIKGYLAKLNEEGWIEGSQADNGNYYRLTVAGEQRLRVLFVDYVQELISLYGVAREVLRKRLAEFYLQGARNVAFYPVGETAEVTYLALQDSGLQLVAAVDDDPMLWDTAFHEVVIRTPKILGTVSIDAVIVTTSVFQSEIIRSIRGLARPELRILLL